VIGDGDTQILVHILGHVMVRAISRLDLSVEAYGLCVGSFKVQDGGIFASRNSAVEVLSEV
jgi:hypothetical protein